MEALPEKERQGYEGITADSRNGKCLTCSEFDSDVSYHTKLSSSMSQSDQKIPHMKETILDICNYPHRHPGLGASFKECRFKIAAPFLEEAKQKGKPELNEFVKKLQGKVDE